MKAVRQGATSRPGARTDGLRVALAIEGGGMRGTVTGGMALALHELGLLPAFDAGTKRARCIEQELQSGIADLGAAVDLTSLLLAEHSQACI